MNEGKRAMRTQVLAGDLVVVGGGMAGVCCAITAAREGLKVLLVTDRPVLGGNASSEVRLWILGATSHMGNNNRWAREGGVIDELLVENMYRNKEGNPVIFDTVILDKVMREANITLLLNTAVYDVEKGPDDRISHVQAFCSQNSTGYVLSAPFFCDASGDGVVGFLAGAAFRMGAESREEFGEKFAPDEAYGELLGHSLYFYSKDVGKPVRYVAPSYALKDIARIPRYRNFRAGEDGCKLWWIEYGGRLDTVYDTESIKWELWKVVYGVWDYIKNSGQFPEAANLTLEWVGAIPGKRETRRFEGDYILRQQDIVEQRVFEDAVVYGGWSIDLHPADGVYSDKPGCNQWHSKGVYQIPYRCLYSRNVPNLLLAGRIISATHVAHASSRVMGTTAAIGQAAGMAAAVCVENGKLPAILYAEGLVKEVQKRLLRVGHYIPFVRVEDAEDLVGKAVVSASSELVLTELLFDGALQPIVVSTAQMLPVDGRLPGLIVECEVVEDVVLEVELRVSSKPFNHTPDVLLERRHFALKKGRQLVTIAFDVAVPGRQYAFVCFMKNAAVLLRRSTQRLSGIVSVFNSVNKAVSNYGKQEPLSDIGVDAFEFWCPARRPGGQNVAMRFVEPLHCFVAENVRNGIGRPVCAPNVWVAAPEDDAPALVLTWAEPVSLRTVQLYFDTDFDHPMESCLMGHPETVMPFCVPAYKVLDDQGRVLYSREGNYQSLDQVVFAKPVLTRQLTIAMEHPKEAPAALFQVKCFAEALPVGHTDL